MFKNISYLFWVLIFLSGCQSVKETLAGTKKSNDAEFLVEKKNPLVQPPEFNKLPEPKSLNKVNKEEINSKDFLDLKKITSNKSNDNTSSSSLEDSILKKIKAN